MTAFIDRVRALSAKVPRLYFMQPKWNLCTYLGVLVFVASLALAFHIPFVYAASFLVASICYGMVAKRLSASDVSGVDAVMTSEVIITCGIASLILHVAIAGFYIEGALADRRGFSEQIVRTAAIIFSEGLACAAFAPVISVVFRYLEGSDTGRVKPSETPEDVASILDDFARRAAGLARNMERLSTAIGASAERYEGAAGRVTVALEALATNIQSKSMVVSAQLSDLESKTRLFGEAVAQVSTDLHKVGSEATGAFSAITDGVKAFGKQVDEFTNKMRTGGVLLDGLRELINSVNRFIRPDPDTKSDSKPT